ncbi:MAG: inverse autotransporter beta domain-containing protein [Chlamydiota bacterium]
MTEFLFAGEEDFPELLFYPRENISEFEWEKPTTPLLVEREDVKSRDLSDSHSHYPTPKRIAMGHSEGKGIGFDYGYTTLDIALAPYYQKGHVLPMIDINADYFDDNTWEANLGVIARYIPKEAPVLPGLNMFYSWREGRRANYQMLTIGFELLGAVWDLRANGYIPIGQRKHINRHKQKFPGGFESEIIDNEFALSGFNAEVGVQFFQAGNFFLYAAGGPYYLTGPFDTKSWGVEGRLQPQYNDYITMNLSVSNDRIFGTIFRAELVLSVPLYNFTSMKNRSGPGKITNRQIYQPVKSFDPVMLSRGCCWNGNF